jgi:hypothetical protein
MKFKKVSETQKMVRPKIWTIFYPNSYIRISI